MKYDPRKSQFAKKSFGQNFLVDTSYINKIVSEINLQDGDTVVEIGPGRGALTRRLLEYPVDVIGIEIERDMIAVLSEEFGDRPNFRLIGQDALRVDFSSLRPASGAQLKLVANLPYYISTAILQHLAEQRQHFSTMVLMFQREVAERITALPSTSERGFLTVIVEAFLDAHRLFDVPPAAFRPAPKVWSSVVKLIPKRSEISNPQLFRKLVSAAFAQRRKTILNNLKSALADAEEILNAAQIAPSRRAESLSLDEWLRLSDAAEAYQK